MFDYENMRDKLEMKKERFLTQDQWLASVKQCKNNSTEDEPRDDSI